MSFGIRLDCDAASNSNAPLISNQAATCGFAKLEDQIWIAGHFTRSQSLGWRTVVSCNGQSMNGGPFNAYVSQTGPATKIAFGSVSCPGGMRPEYAYKTAYTPGYTTPTYDQQWVPPTSTNEAVSATCIPL